MKIYYYYLEIGIFFKVLITDYLNVQNNNKQSSNINPPTNFDGYIQSVAKSFEHLR